MHSSFVVALFDFYLFTKCWRKVNTSEAFAKLLPSSCHHFIHTKLSIILSAIILKAVVRKFCLFVALYVWKPGIAVSCRIIFRAWGCDPLFRHGSSMDESSVLRWMCSCQSRTGVDLYCTSQSQILAYVLEYMTQIRIFTVCCHLNK